jgi:hypothetical protein
MMMMMMMVVVVVINCLVTITIMQPSIQGVTEFFPQVRAAGA